MMKRIGRRLLSLLLTVVTVLTLLPAMTLPALAVTNGSVTGLDVDGIGLSFSGKVDNAWTASGIQIVGSATSGKNWWGGREDYNSTLTITNNKGTPAKLFFDYTTVLSEGTIQVNDTDAKAVDSFSKELPIGGNIKVSIQSGSTSAATRITMTNVRLVSEADATVTFQRAENGSYTVNGKKITEAYTNTQSSTKDYQVVATPADGYRFKGWYNVDTGKIINASPKTALNFDSDCTITARFVSKDLALFETGGLVFDDLDEAVAEAKKHLPATITLAQGGKITGNYEIPSGVTLLIPFDEAKTLYADKPKSVGEYTKPSLFRKLTMAPGSSITVNGAISVGGQHCDQMGDLGPSGPYGQIHMAAGSSITLNRDAKLYAWGYITGDGQITATSGAEVYEYFQVKDWRGGSATSGMRNNKQKVFPFSQYYVQNIEAALTLEAGATETTYLSISAKVVGTKSTSINFIGSSSSKSLFRLGDGGTLTKKYDPKTDRVTYTTTGSASLDSLALSVVYALVTYTFDSKDYVLPVSNNMTLNILSGSVAVNSDAALLPGAQVVIAQGAELKIESGKSLYVYDYNTATGEWGKYCVGNKEFIPVNYSPSGKGSRTLTDAKIDVNGTLTAVGSVYTTQSGANICSSEGTGRFIQTGAPGTGSNTYQCTQADRDITYVSIPITPAQLKNADGADKPYTETKDAKAGDTFTYCTCPTCGGGKWTNTNDLQVAAIINSDGMQTDCSTLKKAVNQFPQSSSGNTYIKLLHNTTEDIKNITKDIYLDLNGRTVTGDISVTGDYKLYGMDSTAGKDYVTAPSGKIVGTVTGTVAPTYETPKVTTTDGDTYDRYVAIQGKEADNETANLSFHHFNISVTGYRFELATGDTPQCALFFIGKFQGDAEAKKHLTSLGFTLPDIDGTTKTVSCKMPESLNDGAEGEKSTVIPEGGAYLFEAYLKRDINKENYQTQFTATAQATFDNGGKQDSEPQKLSFKDAWQKAEDLTDEQKKAILDKLGINQ